MSWNSIEIKIAIAESPQVLL